MISAIINFILAIIGGIVYALGKLRDWYKKKIKEIPEKPINILLLTLATTAIIYGITRIGAFADMRRYELDPPGYTQMELRYIPEKKVDRYVYLQEKTHYYSRYMNTIARYHYRNRPLAAFTYILLTYNNNRWRFHRYVHEQYMLKMYMTDMECYQTELDNTQWMLDWEKKEFTKRMEELKTKQKKTTGN